MSLTAAKMSPFRMAVMVTIATSLSLAMFPDLVSSDPIASDGGAPTAVHAVTDPETCSAVNANGADVMDVTFTLAEESHVLVSFTSEWQRLGGTEAGFVRFDLLDAIGGGEGFSPTWAFAGAPVIDRNSGTVTWTFDGVVAGDHAVSVFAHVEKAGTGIAKARVAACALTVTVVPAT